MSDTASVPRITTVTDSRGRALQVRRMSVGERLRFLKLIPTSAQQNQLWISNAMIIASVVQIGDVPARPLRDETDIEKAGDELGDEGVQAATEALANMLQTASKTEVLASAGE